LARRSEVPSDEGSSFLLAFSGEKLLAALATAASEAFFNNLLGKESEPWTRYFNKKSLKPDSGFEEQSHEW
jgi:hypothetical protein